MLARVYGLGVTAQGACEDNPARPGSGGEASTIPLAGDQRDGATAPPLDVNAAAALARRATLASAIAGAAEDARAGRSPAGDDGHPQRDSSGVRWLLSPASLAALIALVLLVAFAGWWLSRPGTATSVYDGAPPHAAQQELGNEQSASPDTPPATSVAEAGPEAAAGSAASQAGDAPVSTAGSAAGEAPSDATSIEVHVVGAVHHPGLVTVPRGARVADAVAAAGGVKHRANQASVNLARIVQDGEQIVVLRRKDQPNSRVTAPADPETSGAEETLVDLNTADLTALQGLSGIGPALAARIIEWRGQHGGFTSADQLLEVSGIGEATFARLRDHVIT